MIVLNKAHLTGKELEYMGQALTRPTSGNGEFTKKCHQFFRDKYGFKKTLLTPSCTAALEMAAILLNVQPGDEVIVPSFTFVSTANAFVLRGATIVFADSQLNHPNVDPDHIESLITSRTKVIVVVHYAGIAVDMDRIMDIAGKHKIFVVEDAAQAIDAYYKNWPLGSIGHLGCFSFHDTKNVVCGEGGLLAINDESFFPRAEIVWEKGTNRGAFIRGEVDKYGWVDVGSSFLLSEITAAFLYAQLEEIRNIQKRRMDVWMYYWEKLNSCLPEDIFLPNVPDFARHNAHIFYLICNSTGQRDGLAKTLKAAGIQAFFHYPPLHLSKFHLQAHRPQNLPNAARYAEQLIRLPLYPGLVRKDQDFVINELRKALLK
mgnify:CR=1 FL=1